jgi:hypothetical protein
VGALTADNSYQLFANSLVFNVTVVNNVAVFDIPVSALEGQPGNLNPTLTFASDLSGANTAIVINVTGGTSYDQNASNVNFNPTTYENEHVIWNFDGFTSLNFRQWGGAVLAGGADVTNSSPINGFLYAEQFGGNGELHYYPFEGVLSSTTVPESSTWATLLIGFGCLGFTGYRHRRASPTASA